MDVLELIEAGDSVVTIGTPAAKGRLSGVDVQATERPFSGGKIIRIDLVGDRGPALRTVGLTTDAVGEVG